MCVCAARGIVALGTVCAPFLFSFSFFNFNFFFFTDMFWCKSKIIIRWILHSTITHTKHAEHDRKITKRVRCIESEYSLNGDTLERECVLESSVQHSVQKNINLGGALCYFIQKLKDKTTIYELNSATTVVILILLWTKGRKIGRRPL